MVSITQAELDELRADQELLRRLVHNDRSAPDGPLWQAVKWLAEDMAVARIRSASHDLASAQDWKAASSRPSHIELERRRAVYNTDPRSPEQIRRDAYASWGLRDPKAAA